ncbi:MAG: hypothetical protein WC533_02215 [Candidatus Pacearchaeota archaeon]
MSYHLKHMSLGYVGQNDNGECCWVGKHDRVHFIDFSTNRKAVEAIGIICRFDYHCPRMPNLDVNDFKVKNK